MVLGKMFKYEPILKMEAFKGWILNEINWKKIQFNFCIFVALEISYQSFVELKHRKKLTSKWIVKYQKQPPKPDFIKRCFENI